MPPTPQPTTPRPLIMVVWESVPTTLSGYKSPLLSKTTRAKNSRLTWWTIPTPGGTILKFSKVDWPHFKNSNLSLFLSNYFSSFCLRDSGVLAKSTWIEWSMTRSTGHCGLTFEASPPSLATASLIAAKSTTKGTPVKSWRITLDGLNGI